MAVVPHTHWDREWYEPFQTFRLKLVRLVDDLLDRMEQDSSYRHFLLDGQLAVIDDYLEIRPENEGAARRPDRGRADHRRSLVHPDGRVPGVGRDHRPQPPGRAPAGHRLRRGHGRRATCPTCSATWPRCPRSWPRRASSTPWCGGACPRPSTATPSAGWPPTAPVCGPSTWWPATATVPPCPTTPRRWSAGSRPISRSSGGSCVPATPSC